MLSNKEKQQRKLGLKHNFVDKNKNIKKLFLAANMERVAERIEDSFDQNQKENLHCVKSVQIRIFLYSD